VIPILRYLRGLFWRLIFVLKHRAGFISLGPVMTTGVVWKNDGTSDDGDTCFSIVPDDVGLCLVLGKYTSDSPAEKLLSLHCEVSPWMPRELHDQALALKPGDRVSIRGNWAYDGVHLGRGTVIDVLAAIVGHGPSRSGWAEIHPVTGIRRVT
jgi:hypothetical protein